MIDRADSNGDSMVTMDDFYNIMTKKTFAWEGLYIICETELSWTRLLIIRPCTQRNFQIYFSWLNKNKNEATATTHPT